MPKLKNQPPKLCRIKATNTAVVYLNRRRVVMGPWGSKKSLENYTKLLSQWTDAEDKENVALTPKEKTTADLAAAFLKQAEETVDSRDFASYRLALKTIRKRYPHLPVSEFGPVKLGEIQQDFVKLGHSRGYCNKLTGLIRTVFGWGVRHEMVPETVAAALKYVKALREGKTEARETEKRDAVPDAVVDRTLPILWPTVAAMVTVQRFAAMRPNEVCRMTVDDLDMTGEIWIYRPGKHKGTWRGHHKAVALGRPEQEIILPRLEGKGPENAVFSPRDTMAERHAKQGRRTQNAHDAFAASPCGSPGKESASQGPGTLRQSVVCPVHQGIDRAGEPDA